MWRMPVLAPGQQWALRQPRLLQLHARAVRLRSRALIVPKRAVNNDYIETKRKRNMKFITHASPEFNLSWIDFTSLQGHIQATPKQMRAAFGEPSAQDGERVHMHWSIRFADGAVATVYDWNLKQAPADDEIISWSVGGYDLKAYMTVHQAFRLAHNLKVA